MKAPLKVFLAVTSILCLCTSFKSSLGTGHRSYNTKKEKIFCAPTKKIQIDPKPITYDPSYTDNDTIKNAGEFDDRYLNKVFIRGIIKDKHCVPVPNTLIEIWQNDEYGKKRYNKFSYSFNDQYKLNREQYSNFLGISTTTSDNNGHFAFISVIPNSKVRRAKKQSLVNISILHEGFPKVENQICHIYTNNSLFITFIFFNNGIIWPKSVAPYLVHLVTLGSDDAVIKEAEKIYKLPTYDFEMVLDGTSTHKTY